MSYIIVFIVLISLGQLYKKYIHLIKPKNLNSFTLMYILCGIGFGAIGIIYPQEPSAGKIFGLILGIVLMLSRVLFYYRSSKAAFLKKRKFKLLVE